MCWETTFDIEQMKRKSREEGDYVGILLISGHGFHKAPRGFGFRRLGEVVKELSRDTQNCVGIRFWGPQVWHGKLEFLHSPDCSRDEKMGF